MNSTVRDTTNDGRSAGLAASPPLFENRFLDFFSRIHPSIPALIFLPVIAIMAFAGVALMHWPLPWVFAVLAPVSGLIAILLTAGAARWVTRDRSGATVARTGLAVGAASAGIGLLIGGLGVVMILLAAITVVAGVAGAVVGRELPAGSNRL